MTLNNENNNECCKCTTPEITIELNQQGPQGRQGNPGLDGYSPQVEVLSNTNDVYILQITTKDGNITTPNLKATLPPGGNEGDVLTKNSNNNGDVTWINLDSKFVTIQGDQEIEGSKTFLEDIHLGNTASIKGVENIVLLNQNGDSEIEIGESSISRIELRTSEIGNIYAAKINPDTGVPTEYKILHQGNVTAGENIAITETSDGLQISSTTESYTLPIASATTLGGIKVGENLSISDDGILSATGGELPSNVLTSDNISQDEYIESLAGDVSELETSKQNVFTTQKPIYLDKKQESDKVGWGYQDPYLVPQNEINLTQHVSPTYIQYNTDSTNKMPSNYILFPLYEQDTDPASAIIKVPISNSANNYEKLFFGKYVDGYFVPLCYFAYQSFSGSSVRCRPYAIGGVDYTNPSVTSVSTSDSVATINIEGSKVFQMSTRDLQVQGGWGSQSHSSITSQPLDNLFEGYWAYGGNMSGIAINLNRNTVTNTVTGIGCTYTNGTDTYMITSGDTDLCELLSEATFALYCFDVSTPTATNNKDHNLFGYYKYSDTGAIIMPWLLTGQNIDEFWTNVLQHNSFTTGAEILENNNLRLGIDNNTIKVNDDGNLYANISIPSNITTQGNTFNGANQLVQLNSNGSINITGGISSEGRVTANNVMVTTGLYGTDGSPIATKFGSEIGIGSSSTSLSVFGTSFKYNNKDLNTAGGLVQLDSSGKLPAIDGSQLTNLPAGSAPSNMVTTDTQQTITGTKTFNKIILPDTNFTDGIYLGDNTSPSIYGYNGKLNLNNITTISAQALTLNAEDSVLKAGNWSSGTQFTLQLQGINSNTSATVLYTILRARNDLKQIVLGNQDFTVVDYNGNSYLTSANIPTGALKYWTGTETDYTAIDTKDADTLYRTTDTNKVFLGTIQLGGNA